MHRRYWIIEEYQLQTAIPPLGNYVTNFRLKYPITGSPAQANVNIPTRSLGGAAQKLIWAVGGGKGGIGKTLLTSNMGVYLSWLNKKVVVVDMDLGGANLHTSLGVPTPKTTLSDLVLGKVEDVRQLVQPTTVRNLSLISGAQDSIGIANMRHMHKTRLIRKFREIDADFILLDLGAGTAFNTLDFFLLADQKIVVVTPEPTSIENGYRFMKAAFYRMLRANTHSPYVRQLIESAMEAKDNRGINSPRDLLNEVSRLSPSDGLELQKKMEKFCISLIVNQVRVRKEAELGKNIQLVCERYFGMRLDYMGYLPYDNAVWQSIRRRVPFILEAPNSTAVTHLEEILRNLIRFHTQNNER